MGYVIKETKGAEVNHERFHFWDVIITYDLYHEAPWQISSSNLPGETVGQRGL